MNIEEYIESGTLELYVAGMLSEVEAREVYDLLALHPELQAEVDRIEESLEDYANSTSGIIPGYELIQEVMNQVEEQDDAVATVVVPAHGNGNGHKKASSSPTASKAAAGTKKSPSASPPSGAESNFINGRFYAIAASVLLLASLGMNIYLFQRQQRLSNMVSTLMLNNHELKSDMEAQNTRLAVYEDPSYLAVPMEGTQIAANATAIVYWNSETESVYLKVNELPEAESGKQYQLWALQSGNPISLGVFDSQTKLLTMENLLGATQAFAVTLEPSGGREKPSLDQMYMIGNVRM